MYDILIIGGGPAGLTSALYALRYGLKVALFEELSFGGQAATTPEIENIPGIKHITGFDFSYNLYQQVMDLGLDYFNEKVISVNLKEKTLDTSKGQYKGKTMILATGATRRKLEVKGEEEFAGRGVSYCATCDAAFFKDKTVAIVGGGNTALEDAVFLANSCSKVYLIHRRDEFRGMKSLVQRVENNPKIEILYSTIVEEIIGSAKVEKIQTNHQLLDVDGVFIAIGTIPNNALFEGQLELSNGYIVSDETCTTQIGGVYVAGDGRTKALRQIVTACADGASAAFAATNYIE